MIRARSASIPVVLGLAVALSGCSLLPNVNAVVATPTPTALSVEQAATTYVDTICTFNEGARAFADTWTDDSATLRQLKEAASLGQREAEAAKEQLETTAWADELEPDMEVVVTYLDERIAKFDQVLAAETLDELLPIELATTPEGVDESASRIEEALALEDGYCGTDVPVEEPAAQLDGSTWTGTDSDGDDTSITLNADGSASATVGGAEYAGTWELVDGTVNIEVSSTDNALSFAGFWAEGVNTMNLSGTASNGHTWTVLVSSF